MPQHPPPHTYTTLTQLFTTHLTIATHTILASRALYPSTTFLRARAYNLPVMQSRHPGVCQWINDAVAAVEGELLKGTVRRVCLVIWGSWWEGEGGWEGCEEREASGGDESGEGAKPLERYVWDVSRWPEIPKEELHTPFTRSPALANDSLQPQISDAAPQPNNDDQQPPHPPEEGTDEDRRTRFQATLKKAHSDLHEQFRALLSRLSMISEKLAPLPGGAERCTYTMSVELKEDSEPPIGHPQAWVPCEKGLQRRVVHGEELEGEGGDGGQSGERLGGKGKGRMVKEGGRTVERGRELGGVRTTPVRTVDQGEMVFEMWIEEGRGKFENRYTPRNSGTSQSQNG